MRRSLASLASLVVLALPLAGCSSTSPEFQEPDAGEQVVAAYPTSVDDQVVSSSKTQQGNAGGNKSGFKRRGPDNGGSMSKSGGSAGAAGGSAGLLGSVQSGTVVTFDRTTGRGQIDDGQSFTYVPFTRSTVVPGTRQLKVGDKVVFIRAADRSGRLQAQQVQLSVTGGLSSGDNGGSMSKVGSGPGAAAGQQVTGTVLSWYDHRGWGYIVPWDDSENVWFHHSQLQAGYGAPREGDIVCFLVGSRGTRGPQAEQVASC